MSLSSLHYNMQGTGTTAQPVKGVSNSRFSDYLTQNNNATCKLLSLCRLRVKRVHLVQLSLDQ